MEWKYALIYLIVELIIVVFICSLFIYSIYSLEPHRTKTLMSLIVLGGLISCGTIVNIFYLFRNGDSEEDLTDTYKTNIYTLMVTLMVYLIITIVVFSAVYNKQSSPEYKTCSNELNKYDTNSGANLSILHECNDMGLISNLHIEQIKANT
tara:strand:+ start:199 stop:651 length:453 start_codon:yes stop_codon:yes gene_type:complete